MKLHGGISIADDGLNISVRGMHTQMKMMDIISRNITNFSMPGAQREIPIMTSFCEYIGSHGVNTIKDTQPGRMRQTGNPLDFIINHSGYFQIKGQHGVKLTRDGRFEIDKDGYLINLNKEKVLGSDGEPIQFHYIPGNLKDITLDEDGTINLYNKSYNRKEFVGRLSVSSEDGTPVQDVKVIQGFVEDGNINLMNETFALLPLRRNFEASRQSFIILNEQTNKLIQMLGRGQ